jgi:hypothetical protein
MEVQTEFQVLLQRAAAIAEQICQAFLGLQLFLTPDGHIAPAQAAEIETRLAFVLRAKLDRGPLVYTGFTAKQALERGAIAEQDIPPIADFDWNRSLSEQRDEQRSRLFVWCRSVELRVDRKAFALSGQLRLYPIFIAPEFFG